MDKILVVDDDVDILTLAKITLKLNGYIAEGVSRWQEVDSTISNFKPDILLLDVSLGGADGREICKKLKSTGETKHIPVVLFSANVEMEKSIHDCGAEAFLAKPYELSNLLQTLRSTLDNSRM